MRCQQTRTGTIPRLVAPVVVALGVALWYMVASRRARATRTLAALWAAARRRQEAAGSLEAEGRTVRVLCEGRAKASRPPRSRHPSPPDGALEIWTEVWT
jgi:hypothetical protein